MYTIRKADERGHADHGWLNTYHSFSFSNYYDPKHMGFRALRVLNDDVIAGGGGFPFHGHENMEILSYVTEGALEHRDSMGNGSVIRPGDVQLMSAGSGVEHSEFNHLPDSPTHLYQVWIRPATRGTEPNYQEGHFKDDELSDQLRLIASPDARNGSLRINQDALVYAGRLSAGQRVSLDEIADRHVWVQLLHGALTVNGVAIEEGDGIALSEESQLSLMAEAESEVLVFDMG